MNRERVCTVTCKNSKSTRCRCGCGGTNHGKNCIQADVAIERNKKEASPGAAVPDKAPVEQKDLPLEVARVQCQSCGIQIGPDFMETVAYKVGDFKICGWCRSKLAERGHIKVDDRRNWLYPDGTTKPMKV